MNFFSDREHIYKGDLESLVTPPLVCSIKKLMEAIEISEDFLAKYFVQLYRDISSEKFKINNHVPEKERLLAVQNVMDDANRLLRSLSLLQALGEDFHGDFMEYLREYSPDDYRKFWQKNISRHRHERHSNRNVRMLIEDIGGAARNTYNKNKNNISEEGRRVKKNEAELYETVIKSIREFWIKNSDVPFIEGKHGGAGVSYISNAVLAVYEILKPIYPSITNEKIGNTIRKINQLEKQNNCKN